MMRTTFIALLAATAAPETPLGVTATVIRPVEISASPAETENPMLVLRNTEAVEVEVSGASVFTRDTDTIVITSDGSGAVAITLIF